MLWSGTEWVEGLQQRVFERRLGVSTSGRTYLDEAGIADEAGGVFYEGCQWIPVRRALRALRPGPGDVFVDLGSGKGQALLIAGQLPFGRVTGVELLDSLTQVARGNLQRARARLQPGSLEAVTADVLEWPVPDDLSVVFMYCPFTDELFEQAMDRIFASYDRNPRPLHIVYVFPWEHDRLMRSGRLAVADVRPAQWPAKPWWWHSAWVIVTYRVVGPGEGGPGAPTLPRKLLRPRRAIERWSRPNGHHFRLMRDGEVVRESSR